MMKTLIRKELLDNFLSLRFIVSSVIIVFIMALSVAVNMQDYANKRDDYNQNMLSHEKRVKEKENYLEVMFSGIGAERPPAELQMFYTGVEKNPNRSTMIFPFFKPRFMGELNINPVFPLFPAIDLLFIVSIVFSLIAFVFSYDAVCGEREMGTLKLLMSFSIPRDKIIMAKWLGGYLSVAIAYLAGVILCVLTVMLYPRAAISPAEWSAFGLTVLVSLLFLGVMYSIGLFVSVISKRSSTSISILLFIWVVFVLIIPNAAPFIVDKVHPIDSPSVVMSRIKYKAGNTIQDLLGDTVKAFEEATGIKVDQIDFSNAPGMEDSGDEEEQDQEEQAEEQQKQRKSSSSEASSARGGAAAKAPAGFDMAKLEEIALNISDSDLRDLQIKGCERWLDEQIKAKAGMTLSQAAAMAKNAGYELDMQGLIRQCDEKKNDLIKMKREAAFGDGSAPAAAQAAPVQEEKKTEEPESGKKVTIEQYWAKFMALPDDDKGRFFDSMYQSFITMNKSNSKISAEEEEKYERNVDQQVAATKMLSRVSPVSSYIYAVTDLANTGIEREKHLKEYLWSYQTQFLDFLTEKFNTPDSERVHQIFGGAFREAEFNLDDLPKFKYKPMELNRRISYVLIDIVALFIFAIFFFLLAYTAFIKAEIID